MTWNTNFRSLSLKCAAVVSVLVSFTIVQWSHAQQAMIFTKGDNTVNMLLTEKQGETVKQYLGKLKGSITVDAERRITALSGAILSLETADKKTMAITKSELRDGTILLTTKEGTVYAIYDLSSNLAGSIRLEK
jgi:hypothetical protein